MAHFQPRQKRSPAESTPIEIAKIMPNNDVCFAGRKLKIRMNEENEEQLRAALNTIIMLMSHRHGESGNHFQTI